MQLRTAALATLAVLALLTTACGDDSNSEASPTTTASAATTVGTTAATTTSSAPTTTKPQAGPLVGTFEITAGACTAGAPTAGSYFRMVQAQGTVTDGPFIANADSLCGDKTYTALAPGSDGGLKTGSYQPQPDPPFDGTQNGLAAAIVAPIKFFAVNFAVSTNPKDPQTGSDVAAPTLTAGPDGALTGATQAVSVAWNGQQFNQGSPKPDGSRPGLTTDPHGTYDAATGAYTVEWTSEIVGGPFNGFTGVWHLQGTFKAA